MICWLDIDVPVGTKITGIWDFERNWHNQPAVVIRKATAQEYYDYHLAERGWAGDMKYLNGRFFYEISTD